jgi:hypothetical protein
MPEQLFLQKMQNKQRNKELRENSILNSEEFNIIPNNDCGEND